MFLFYGQDYTAEGAFASSEIAVAHWTVIALATPGGTEHHSANNG
jgi:hypothetical protein